MKKLMMIIAGALMVLAGASCQKINDLESRVSDLESAVEQLKSQVEAGAVVTKVEETATGYSLTLSNGKTYNVTNGAKGDKGDKGEKGEKGDKGADGDAFFGSVTVDPQTSTVTLVILKDGGATETIVIPMYVDSAVKTVKSIKFIPEYSDGKAVCTETKDGTRTLSASFDVRPAGVAAAIASKDIISLSVNAVATKAAAPSALAVATVEESNGIITVTADATAITAEAFSIALVAKDAAAEISSDYAVVAVEKTYVEYAGVKYNTVRLKDGRVWMAENLRYVPEGKTPSTDKNALDNGVWYPIDLDTKTIVNDDEKIKAQGLLYNAEAAFGIAPGTIDETNYDKYEGCQGICPDGWHIPTGAEIFKVVGRMASWPGSPTATSPDKSSPSPYYDGNETTLGNCMMDLLNADGFNIAMVGTITATTAAATTGTIVNTMSYILGSTAYTGYTSLIKNDKFNNAQYFSFMPMKNNGTANGATYNYRSAAVVRCIKD